MKVGKKRQGQRGNIQKQCISASSEEDETRRSLHKNIAGGGNVLNGEPFGGGCQDQEKSNKIKKVRSQCKDNPHEEVEERN